MIWISILLFCAEFCIWSICFLILTIWDAYEIIPVFSTEYYYSAATSSPVSPVAIIVSCCIFIVLLLFILMKICYYTYKNKNAIFTKSEKSFMKIVQYILTFLAISFLLFFISVAFALMTNFAFCPREVSLSINL